MTSIRLLEPQRIRTAPQSTLEMGSPSQDREPSLDKRSRQGAAVGSLAQPNDACMPILQRPAHSPQHSNAKLPPGGGLSIPRSPNRAWSTRVRLPLVVTNPASLRLHLSSVARLHGPVSEPLRHLQPFGRCPVAISAPKWRRSDWDGNLALRTMMGCSAGCVPLPLSKSRRASG